MDERTAGWGNGVYDSALAIFGVGVQQKKFSDSGNNGISIR